MFAGRNWPEGYEFPACGPCNQGSSLQDRLFAFTATVPVANALEGQRRVEWLALIRDINKDHPGLLQSLVMSTAEKRGALRSLAIALPPGQTIGGTGMLRSVPDLEAAVQVVLTKLAKAVHYKQAGRIVPSGAAVQIRLYPNSELLAGRFPSDLLNELLGEERLRRSGRDLGDQFNCWFGVTDDGANGVYICTFGESMAAGLTVLFSPDVLDLPH